MSRLSIILAALVLTAAPQALAAKGKPFTDYIRRVNAFPRAKLAPHPRLLLTPKEQQRVRSAIATPEGKPYWDAVCKAVDTYRKAELIPDPAPFKDGKWTIEEWRRIVNAGGDMQNKVVSCAFKYVMTRDPADLAEAKRWTMNAAGWNPNGPSGIEGVDHPAHDVLRALCVSYDWLYDQWTLDEKAKIVDSITKRGRALYRHLKPYTYDSWNNHPWFQTTAMVDAGLAIADEVEEADAWWRYGSELYFTEYLPLGGRDGDWHEGTHYVSYTLIFVYEWANDLLTSTGINAYDIDWLKKVGYFRLYTAPPMGGGIHFNDNNVRPPDAWDRMTAFNAARTTRDPVLQWYAESMQTQPPSNALPALYTVIYRDATVEPAPPGPLLPKSVWFRDSGWVVFRGNVARSDDVQFGLKAGPYLSAPGNKGHDHPDQGSFLINHLTEPLIVDSGYYDWYGSPHHNNWTFTPKAHNTFVIDGKPQMTATQGADGKVTAFIGGNNSPSFVECESAAAYPKDTLNSWRRQVVFIRPDVFVIRDVVKPVQKSVVEMLLHGPNEFAVAGRTLAVKNQKAALTGLIAAPNDLRITQWGGFPEDAQPERKKPENFPDQWHLTAATGEPVVDTVFLSAFCTRENAKLEIKRWATPSHDAFTLIVDGKEWRMSFSDGDNIGAGVVVSEVKSTTTVRQILLANTKYHVENRRLVWKSAVPADISGVRRGIDLVAFEVRMRQAGRVSIGASAEPKSVTVDGKPVKFEWNAKEQAVSFVLPDGTSRVVVK
ncbi:MAG TPA: DUF4962 domain-containing protein [Armatimonadota bacterium]|nr:DUF4962 domain-containing protein [Armatimonadota bacterium]